MSLKPRPTKPTIEALQRIMSTFKQFEMKLDKLQDDVSYHGQTLNDLRSLVVNISAGTLASPDSKSNEIKRPKVAAALQYDNYDHPVIKTKRRNIIQPLPSKLKTRSFNLGSRIETPYRSSLPYRPKLTAGHKGNPVKRKTRPNKADVLRKAATLRMKNLEKRTITKTPLNSVV